MTERSDLMAHLEKYTAGAMGHMLAHYDRTHSSSTSLIDESRTALNRNLAGIDQPLSQLDFIHKRLSEIKVHKRADVNVFCDWIVTAPKELSSDELPMFFNETYKFLNDRYGKENVISAYVHMDETTPHIHYAFVPIVTDKKKGIPKLSAKERITRKDLNTFHPDLTKHMTKIFGRDIGIQNDATALGNQTVKQLRQKSENLEQFKIEPVPVTEIPPIVKKFLKEDKVIIDRKELERVNQAAEDAAIIMSNAESVNAQLAEKAKKTDKNYDLSEKRLADADNRAKELVTIASSKAADMIIDAEKDIAADKAKWEETKAEVKSAIDDHLTEIEQREHQLSEREAKIEQQEEENRAVAEQNARDSVYNDKRRRECQRREEELDKRAEDQCGYYLKKIDNMSLHIENLKSAGKELSRDNMKLHNELDRYRSRNNTLSDEITDLKQQITNNEASHRTELQQQTNIHTEPLKNELEKKEQEITAKFEPIIAEKNKEIKKSADIIKNLRSALDKAYSFIRDICLGVATLVCGRDSNAKYNADLCGKPEKLAQAIINLGERVTAEAGFDEYSDEIETTYGICDSVREELDDIDPPRPYISEMVR
jgi:hypothetical protein